MAEATLWFVVDENGRKTAAILDIASYDALLARIAELEDALQLDESARLRARFSFIGSGSSGRRDISVNHDEALGEDFK